MAAAAVPSTKLLRQLNFSTSKSVCFSSTALNNESKRGEKSMASLWILFRESFGSYALALRPGELEISE